MPRYILNMSYSLKEGRQDEFRTLSNELKQHFRDEMGKDYRIYEVKGRPRDVIEQFVCESQEAFDALEDDSTEKGEELVNRLTELIEGGTINYSTLVEL